MNKDTTSSVQKSTTSSAGTNSTSASNLPAKKRPSPTDGQTEAKPATKSDTVKKKAIERSGARDSDWFFETNECDADDGVYDDYDADDGVYDNPDDDYGDDCSEDDAYDVDEDRMGFKPFPIDDLPPVFRNFVAACVSAIGCDPSYVALLMLACLARAIGNKRTVKLKPDWTEPAIIWGAIIGKSGTHKSPARRIVLPFLEKQESNVRQNYQAEMRLYEPQRARYEQKLKQWTKGTSELPAPISPEEPVCERFVVGDITIEAAAAILERQFDGLLIAPDELNNFLGSFGQYKRGASDKSQWLDAWGGDRWTIDRKTGPQKTIDVPRASVSIVGGIQPGVLARSFTSEYRENGLAARFLLAWPPSRRRKWSDAIVNPSIMVAINRVFEKLFSLRPALKGNIQAPIAMPLTIKAQRNWIDEYNDRGDRMESLDDDPRAAFSKLEAYTARIALILELCSWAAGEEGASDKHVSDKSMIRAMEIARWFENEALRVYQRLNESQGAGDERELIALIRRRGGDITPRELMQSSRRYRGENKAEDALHALTEAGLGDWSFRLPTAVRCFRLT